MTVRRILVSLAVLVSLWGDAPARACGDKFLIIGKGVRAQRARGAAHHASILIYLDPASEISRSAAGERLAHNLKLAGHSVRSLSNREELTPTLSSGRYDIVLTELGDLDALAPIVGGAGKARLVPVLFDPTEDELLTARKDHPCLMKSGSTKQELEAVIDKVLTQTERRKP